MGLQGTSCSGATLGPWVLIGMPTEAHGRPGLLAWDQALGGAVCPEGAACAPEQTCFPNGRNATRLARTRTGHSLPGGDPGLETAPVPSPPLGPAA